MTRKNRKSEPTSKRIAGDRKLREELGPLAFVLTMIARRRPAIEERRRRLAAQVKPLDETDK